MRSIAVRLGIIGAIAVGAFVARPFLTGNAGNLQVGDCFDEPADLTQEIDDVQHHPCTDPHDAEVIFVGDYAPATDTYPAESEFADFETDQCFAAFLAYTGIDFTTDETYNMGTLRPTPDGWRDNDHEIACYAFLLDETPLTKSIKKA